MTFKSPEKQKQWEDGLSKNQDPYGNAVYQYASTWATLMEQFIAKGEKLEDCAERASHEADEGITGFLHGCAVSMLAAWWVNGEALRQWSNLKLQIGNEGEEANKKGTVLNPALLRVR